jgi:hypothetical protein
MPAMSTGLSGAGSYSLADTINFVSSFCSRFQDTILNVLCLFTKSTCVVYVHIFVSTTLQKSLNVMDAEAAETRFRDR